MRHLASSMAPLFNCGVRRGRLTLRHHQDNGWNRDQDKLRRLRKRMNEHVDDTLGRPPPADSFETAIDLHWECRLDQNCLVWTVSSSPTTRIEAWKDASFPANHWCSWWTCSGGCCLRVNRSIGAPKTGVELCFLTTQILIHLRDSSECSYVSCKSSEECSLECSVSRRLLFRDP